MIQINKVSKSFEQLKVLDNISFSASSAEITSIIGPKRFREDNPSKMHYRVGKSFHR